MEEQKNQKHPLSKIDIMKGKLDEIFIKNGLKASVWKEKKSCGAYFPHQERD